MRLCYCLLTLLVSTVYSDNILRIELKRTKSLLEDVVESSFNEISGDVYSEPPSTPKPNDTESLFKYLDSEFYGEIGIGHPAQTFRVIFDTTWQYEGYVPSITCSPYVVPACANHNRYDSFQSGTHLFDDREYQAVTEFGNVTGYLSIDNINIGHSMVGNLTFGEAESIPKELAILKSDGVLGLPYSNFTARNTSHFFFLLINDRIIDKPIFSIYFNRDETTDKGGSILLGGSDPKHIIGEFTVLPVIPNQESLWKIRMDDIIIKWRPDRNMTLCKSGCEAYADTGRVLMSGPSNEIILMNAFIRAQEFGMGHYVVDCNQIDKLPDVLFYLQGRNFTLKGKDYTQRIVQGPVMTCLSGFVDRGLPDNAPWSLGGLFLAKFYTKFDLSLGTISFSQSNI